MSGSSSKHQLPESLDTGRVIAFGALIISLQRAVVTETRHGPGLTGNGLWIVGTDLHIGELTKSAVAPVYILVISKTEQKLLYVPLISQLSIIRGMGQSAMQTADTGSHNDSSRTKSYRLSRFRF